MIHRWRLDTPAQTLVLEARDGRLAEVVYWSAPLEPGCDLAELTVPFAPSYPGGVLDCVQPVTVCPLAIDGFTGLPGLEIRRPDGAVVTARLRLTGVEEAAGALALSYTDPEAGVRYRLQAEAKTDADVILLSAEAEADASIIAWLSAPVLPAGPEVTEALEFHGRWCGEFRPERTPLLPGARLRENRLGRSAHEHFPGLFLLAPGTTETAGEAFGLTLAQSCGHRHLLETLPDGRTQVQFGPAPGQFPGASAKAGPLVISRSGAGLNGVSQSFHGYLRAHALNFSDPARPRPVHYNCWEAVYFGHDHATLADLADRAADLGVERFVLDDGWFGRRDDDTSSLGDWWVDRRKWPDGLSPLIEHVHRRGMTFGLWFEPEMVNLDSDLARAHPDWILGPADQVTGRQQHVLDLSIPGVTEYLFDAIDAVLRENAIDYIKWDHNRVLPFPDPRQADALYALLARLRAAHPGAEIESCASGGGRIDFGILHHTQRVWLSDSNDAQERLKIQRGASYFIPPEITGSHIGPRVCHTSGRILPMGFRAAVAGARAMGLEMDLRELTEDEFARVKAEIAAFKVRRGVIHGGVLHRLESNDPQVLAEVHVAQDRGAFVLFAGQVQPSDQTMARPIRLAGLDPAARYRVRLENPGDVPGVLNRGPMTAFRKGEAVEVSGQVLMQAGVRLPNAFPDTVWTVTGEKT